MASFFEELFGLKPKRPRPRASEGDRVEDGFLLVGETATERSTVNPGDSVDSDLPPSYNNIQGNASYHSQPPYPNTGSSLGPCTDIRTSGTCLPSYTQAQTMPSWRTDYERLSSLEQSVPSHSGLAGSAFGQPHVFECSSSTALTGVPFQLCPALESQFSRSRSDTFTMVQKPNWSEYDYDFALEMQILREYGLPNWT